MGKTKPRRGKRTHKLILNGREVSRREFLRKRIGGVGVAMGTTSAYRAGKPLDSLALSCHRDLAADYNAEAQRQGLKGIVWDKEGDCHISSRRDRAKWLRSQKQHDDDGGYGDG